MKSVFSMWAFALMFLTATVVNAADVVLDPVTPEMLLGSNLVADGSDLNQGSMVIHEDGSWMVQSELLSPEFDTDTLSGDGFHLKYIDFDGSSRQIVVFTDGGKEVVSGFVGMIPENLRVHFEEYMGVKADLLIILAYGSMADGEMLFLHRPIQ